MAARNVSGVPDGNRVEDGRLIRQARPEDVSEEEQEYWNKAGQSNVSIHCQVCRCSYEGTMAHIGAGRRQHAFKAKVPGVNYE